MKKSTLLFFVMVMTLLLGGCSGIQTINIDEKDIIAISDMENSPSRWAAFYKKMDDGKKGVIKVSQGTVLPMDITINLGVATVEQGNNKIRFDRDVYLYFQPNGILLSPDGKSWTEFDNKKALKKLFKMGDGKLGIGFGATTKKGTVMSLVIETGK